MEPIDSTNVNLCFRGGVDPVDPVDAQGQQTALTPPGEQDDWSFALDMGENYIDEGDLV